MLTYFQLYKLSGIFLKEVIKLDIESIQMSNSAVSPNKNPSDGLLQVGDHCAFCNELDFLPFICDGCGSSFCQNHRKPELHECKKTLKQAQQQRPVGSKPLTTTVKSNTKPYTNTATAQKTAATNQGKRLGGTGQPTATAKDTPSASTKNNNLAALQKLKAIWGSKKTPTSSSTTKSKTASESASSGSSSILSWKKPSFATQRAQELKALAQLKNDAKGDAKIPLDSRIYLYIESPDGLKKAPLYYKKDMVTGVLLDRSADALRVNLSTLNKTDNGSRIALFLSRTNQFLPYNEKLDKTLGGAIKNGDTLQLKFKPA